MLFFFLFFFIIFSSTTSTSSCLTVQIQTEIRSFREELLSTDCYDIDNIPMDCVQCNILYFTPLLFHFAIRFGPKDVFDDLVEKVDVNQRCLLGLTPLHHAFLSGNNYFIKSLLEHKADPLKKAFITLKNGHFLEGKSFIEKTFLFTPITDEYVSFMKSVLPEHWSFSEIYKESKTMKNESLTLWMVKNCTTALSSQGIIYLLCYYYNFSTIVSFFYTTFPIDQMISDFLGETNLKKACENGNNLAVMIFDRIFNVSLEYENNSSLLLLAVKHNHPLLVDYLLARGCNPSTINVNGQTGLHISVYSQNPAIIKSLIKYSCDPNIKDFKGRTALHLACLLCNKVIIKTLLDNGADINISDFEEKKALHYAMFFGVEDVIFLLINRGCDIDAQDSKKRTALHLASYLDHRHIANILMIKGCDPLLQDVYGRRAYQISFLIDSSSLAALTWSIDDLLQGK